MFILSIFLLPPQRVIDVLKIDVEGHEWDVIDNLMETNMFPSIRQFMLEFHLFPDWPVQEDYVYLYKVVHFLTTYHFSDWFLNILCLIESSSVFLISCFVYVQIYTRLREMGFREFSVGPHPKTLDVKHFNNQGDSEFVNAFFSAGDNWT